MAQWYEVLPIALEEVGLQVYITAGLLPVFFFVFFAFFFHRIFTLWLVWLIMAVSGADMLGAASFSRRAGIPSSPVPFDVLSSLSWRCTNAADSGYKENKDWLKLKFKHSSVLSWFRLRGGMLESNFSTTFVKWCAKTVCNSEGIRGCFSIYCDRINRSWRLRCNRFVGKDFLNSFPVVFPIQIFLTCGGRCNHIATFKIYGWKFTGYLILICSFSSSQLGMDH